MSSRRTFITTLATAGSLLGAMPALALTREPAPALSVSSKSAAPRLATPILSFHLDQPYLDWTGEGIPYVPPAGARSGDAIACLSEADLFSCMQRY
jgi:hypothetical protein